MRRRAWVYVVSILCVGAALSGLTQLTSPPAASAWPLVALLLVLATLAQLFKAEAPNHVLFYATPVFFFAGVLLLPARLIILLIALPHLVEWVRERVRRSPHLRAWYLQPFNVAMYTIAALGAHATYTALAASLDPRLAFAALAAVLLAALVYVLLNYLLLSMALVLARGVSWRESGLLDLESQLTDLILLCVGAIVATLWHVNPWLIALALTPLVLMYRALLIPQLKQQARTDGKTGLANAQHFGALFAAELDRAQRFARPLAMIMADLDRFKAINDTYGHLAGDMVLGAVGRIIRTSTREYDIVGRFGGEEFAIVLPEVGLAEAQAFAERLRLAVEVARVPVPTSPTPLSVTLSLGIACFPEHGDTPAELTQEADAALYEAKAGGRNRVVCAAMPGSTSVEPGMAAGLPATLLAPASAPEPPYPQPHPHVTPAPTVGGEERRSTGGGADKGVERGQDRVAPSDPPRRNLLWLFVGGVIAAGLGAALPGTLAAPAPSLPLLGLLCSLAVAAELLRVDLYGRGAVPVSASLLFAAALLTGIPGLACVSPAVALAHHLRQGRRAPHLHRAAFTAATHVLAGLAPALLVPGTRSTWPVPHLPLLAAAVIGAALAYYAIETGLMATAIGLTDGVSVPAIWQTQYRWQAGHYLMLGWLGLTLVLAHASMGLLGVLVFALPIVMLHVAQKQYVTGTRESVREVMRLHLSLSHAALTDPLTGLGNRRAFQEELQRAVGRAARYGEPIALACVDLDEFTAVNDAQGPAAGDRMLVALAGVLRDCRAADRAYHLGGDEFALLLPHTSLADATVALERLRQEALQRLGGPTLSIGVGVVDPGTLHADLALEQAEAALREAKRRGRNAVVTFAEIADDTTLASSAQAHTLRRLLLEQQVSVAFQPIWDLQEGRVLAYEALTRPATHYGFAGPQEVFDTAERLGRTHDLDAICRRAILARAADLPPDTLLFLNVSPQTLEYGALAGDTLVAAVVAAGLRPERVVLEITERSLARLPAVVREARRLRGVGFRLALDDVGAGNAGLQMLSQVPVDFIKVDRAVVAQAAIDTTADAVLAAIVAFAGKTGSRVVAEGIETTAMLTHVRAAGVACAQGYLLGRPDTALAPTPALPRTLSA